MDDEQVEPIYARIYTDFFKRDPQLYALGDWRFSKPKSLKAVGYTLLLILVWSFPILMTFGFAFAIQDFLHGAIVFGPPLLLGSIMSKPLFHNKPLIKDLKSIFRYLGFAHTYADLKAYEYDNNCKMCLELWIADPDCYNNPVHKAKIRGKHAKKR